MTTFDDLDKRLHRGDKPVPSRKVGNNTYAQRRADGSIAIKLHDTDVVTHYPDGSFVLNTGGWLSVTTKARMSEWTPQCVQVFSTKGRWRVTYRSALHTRAYDGQQYSAPDWDSAVAYKDGMRFFRLTDAHGWVVGGVLTPDEQAKQDAHNKQIEKWINRYLRHMDQAKLTHLMAFPNDITCAMCLTFHGPADKIGNRGRDMVLVGEAMGDTQHLIDHLMDKEIPYSLWVYASKRANRSGARVSIPILAKHDLRNYLRSVLIVGQISSRGGVRRVA